MKKLLTIILACFTMLANSQSIDYEYPKVTDKTKDEAFATPTSVLTGTTWYSVVKADEDFGTGKVDGGITSLKFMPNGVLVCETVYDYSDCKITKKFTCRWKRTDKIYLEISGENAIASSYQVSIQNKTLSERKLMEEKTKINAHVQAVKAKREKTKLEIWRLFEKNELLIFNKDFLAIKDPIIGLFDVFLSQAEKERQEKKKFEEEDRKSRIPPTLNLMDLNDSIVNIAGQQIAGKPFIVLIFKIDKERREPILKTLCNLYSKWQDETDVRIIAINTDPWDRKNEVKSYIADNSCTQIKVYFNPQDTLDDCFPAWGITPRALLFGKNGRYKYPLIAETMRKFDIDYLHKLLCEISAE